MISLSVAFASLVVSVFSGGWKIYQDVSDRKETLSITHDDASAVTNCVERLQDHVTAFSLSLVIANASLTQTITIAAYWLEIPWKDADLHLLYDPHESGERLYRFSSPVFEFNRDTVLNHQLLGLGILKAGEHKKGTLLVQGIEDIPFDLYSKREWIPVTVVVLDTRGKQHRSKQTFVMPKVNSPGVESPKPPNPIMR